MKNVKIYLNFPDRSKKEAYHGEVMLQKGDLYQTCCGLGLRTYEVIRRDFYSEQNEWTIQLEKSFKRNENSRG